MARNTFSQCHELWVKAKARNESEIKSNNIKFKAGFGDLLEKVGKLVGDSKSPPYNIEAVTRARDARDIIKNYTTSLKPLGGKAKTDLSKTLQGIDDALKGIKGIND